ncbi:hypothetical protein NQ318_006839 [Aromia moschata]|uniref:Uncharacterized protein n=1 Tax=Aromia moschata TaxID=1265417 RepID=A0AAV8YJC9_9CUCU|nr:hypothetical protein NQ318_006839 [Aromia moschata]
MSGDVQPRKRKDKKRRKDEVGEQILTQTAHTPVSQHPTSPSDDVNIHVHKEGGTGVEFVPNWCFLFYYQHWSSSLE